MPHPDVRSFLIQLSVLRLHTRHSFKHKLIQAVCLLQVIVFFYKCLLYCTVYTTFPPFFVTKSDQ